MYRFITSISLLSLLLLCAETSAQNDFRRWLPENGVAIRQGWHIEWWRSGASRTEGELVGEVALVWSDCRSGDRGVYVQVYDVDGEPKFPPNGLLVADTTRSQMDPVIHPCSDGGWFVGWVDFCDDSLGNIHCTKIDSDGEHLWGDNERGVTVCAVSHAKYSNFSIVEDADCGCFVAWRDQRRGDNGDIYAMHVLSNGELDENWEENGIPVVTAPGWQGWTTTCSDEEGGFIVCWKDGRIDDDDNIWAQRITPDGELLWGDGEGIIICNNDAHQYRPKLCIDGSGGAFIAWADDRNYFETGKDIYVQHINADGQLLWGDEGIALCEVEEEQINCRIIS